MKVSERIKKIQVEMLLEVDRICEKHNIKYQLFAGTLLGAVRHQGFIPWDDDIDICMLRKDYEKFIEIASKEMNSEYFLQTFKTDAQAINTFCKIRKNKTLFIELNTIKLKIHQGIFIDIFPLDNYIINKNKCIKKRMLFWKNILTYSNTPVRNTKGLKKIFHIIAKTFKIIPSKMINKKLDKLYKKFNHLETENVTHLTNGINKNRDLKFLYKRTDFDSPIVVSFENNDFPAPKRYDKILNQIYGDYLKLPPKDKRIPHHAIFVAFDDTKLFKFDGEKYIVALKIEHDKYMKMMR